ncbi:MAG: hypothetical protein ACRCX2_30010 [Paraclostridium sp.]
MKLNLNNSSIIAPTVMVGANLILLSDLIDREYMVNRTMLCYEFKVFALDRAIEESDHYELLQRLV